MIFLWFCVLLVFSEDKGDQILDYTQEIQTMDEQLKKLQKEVQSPELISTREILPSDVQKHFITLTASLVWHRL